MRTLALLTCATVLASGCTGIGLADDVDLDWDFAPLIGPSDSLHMPYVAGSSFGVYTNNADADDVFGWTVESADSAVLRVDSTEDGRASVTAVGEGVATVSLYDADGNFAYDTELEVRQADRAVLLAHGALIIDRPEMQEEWDEIQVLAGGSATFEIHWYDGEERLYGNGALSVVTTGDITVQARQSFLFEDREWVTFSPNSPGTYDVELRANGVAVRTVRIIAVSEDAVDAVILHGMNESQASQGDTLTVLAQAHDVEGRPIFGVEYTWDLDGEDEEALGDLFRYNYVPGAYAMLGARTTTMDAHVMIQANEGWVDSTNRIGCSATGGGSTVALAPMAIGLGLVVFGWRKRRAR